MDLDKVHRFQSEIFKIEKCFTVFKTINYFLKIKEEFSVKRKIFSVYHYFASQ
jgi:hypothetical protein